jgi:hypothetical protein
MNRPVRADNAKATIQTVLRLQPTGSIAFTTVIGPDPHAGGLPVGARFAI